MIHEQDDLRVISRLPGGALMSPGFFIATAAVVGQDAASRGEEENLD